MIMRKFMLSAGDTMPEWLSRFLKRRIGEISGTGLFLLAGGMGLSLWSWSAADPSFNTVTGDEAGNWLGRPGAFMADILLQFFGLAAIGLIVIMALWGWKLVAHRALPLTVTRLAAWILGSTFLAGSLSLLPAPSGWPLPAGLGGALGLLVQTWVAGFMTGTVPPEARPALDVAILVLPALLLLLYAGHLRLRDMGRLIRVFGEEGRDRIASGLGAVAHYSLSLRAVWQRLTGRLAAAGQWFRRRTPETVDMAPADDPWDEEGRDEAEMDEITAYGESGDPLADTRQTPGFRRSLSRLFRRRKPGDTPAPGGRIEPVFFSEDADSVPDIVFEGDDDPDPVKAAKAVKQIQRNRKKIAPGKRARAAAQPELPFSPPEDYQLPSLNLLSRPKARQRKNTLSDSALNQNARLLEGVLEDFGIRGEIIKVCPGPVVTLYELRPAPGIKSSRVIGLADDIARSMSAISARVAVIPARNVIGIELPNRNRETVFLHELIGSTDYENTRTALPLVLGKNIGGEPIITDLARMPHLLIAGTTGSGKSVGINTMILSLLYRMPPERCKLIMVDPKMLELSIYEGIPHLLTPVVTDPKKAVVALKWTVKEMESRYQNMSKLGVRNIDGFNARLKEAEEKGEVLTRKVQTGFDRETGRAIYEEEELSLEFMPYIVVVIDEMADLMMVAGKDIEGALQRLAQMARAAGIHMITATQRPSVDVITGTIKANFPTRISFQVTSKIDSRTILGEMGAEQLLGMGDMLYMAGGGRITRVHGAFVSDHDVEKVVEHLKTQGVPQYLEAVLEEPEESAEAPGQSASGTSKADQLYDQAIAVVARDRKVSTSYIQRKLSIGYNRAATIIERMEEDGIISAANHAGKREILLPEPEEVF